jgi:hypothetical protein
VLTTAVASIPTLAETNTTFFHLLYALEYSFPGHRINKKYSTVKSRRARHGMTMLVIPAAIMSLLWTCA